ncbi:MAG: LexA family protein [Leptospirillia bacterium]
MSSEEKKISVTHPGIGARMRELRGRIPRTELAEQLGVGLTTVIRYEKEERVPDVNYALAVCERFKVNLDWLLKGEGPRYVGQGNTEVVTGPRAVAYYPLISWVQAGQWQEVIDNYHPGDGEAMVPSSKQFGDRTYCLRVVGDSMEPKVPEGSIIFVDPDHTAENGCLAVVRLDEEQQATFKKLVMDGDRKYLTPINPRYPVMEVTGPATICGVVRRIQIPAPLAQDLD